MELITVKNILGITSDKDDSYLAEVIPLFLEFAEHKTNNSFPNGEEPGGIKLFVAKACEFNMKESGLKSRSMGQVSYSYDTDLPESLMKLLKPYKKVKLHG